MPNQFILRFKDISDIQKIKLAQRIKKTAKQYSIRKDNGPNIEKIYETLEEINPIIFAEGGTYEREYPHQSFGYSCTYTIQGYNFNKLTRAIYYLTCLQKLNSDKIDKILQTTSQNWNKIQELLERNNIISEDEIERPNLTEIGMEDVTAARTQAERGGANNPIPREIQTRNITIEDIRERIGLNQPVSETVDFHQIYPIRTEPSSLLTESQRAYAQAIKERNERRRHAIQRPPTIGLASILEGSEHIVIDEIEAQS